jgi:pimeloyl-ACP methyl ester carboxylesterase
MKIIDVKTKSENTLFGCLYGEKFKDTCVIITNGTCGNIFENKFLQVVGEELEKNKISFIYAHNSGAFHRMDSAKNGNPIGNTYDLFDNCLEDLQAYVDFAKGCGFKHIILGGHSYGANKVVYYLSQNQKEKIDKYILISPTDTSRLKDHEQKSAEELMPIALKLKKEGRLDDIMPTFFDDYNYYTARAFLDFIENKHAKNLPVYSKNGDWKQLKNIKQMGLFVMGEKDGYAFGNTLKHLEIMKSNTKSKDAAIKVVENCGHTFRGKEKQLAKVILDFVKE